MQCSQPLGVKMAVVTVTTTGKCTKAHKGMETCSTGKGKLSCNVGEWGKPGSATSPGGYINGDFASARTAKVAIAEEMGRMREVLPVTCMT